MSSDFTCVRPENQIVITILENDMQTQLARYNHHVSVVALPYRKAMKVVSKLDFIIKNEFHAKALDGIDTKLGDVIASGLKLYGQYDAGRGEFYETKACQSVIKEQIRQALEKRKKTKTIRISKLYIPSKQKDTGENTATRAMFIVLGLSHIADEKGLTEFTIRAEARKYTPVDMDAKHDTYRVYDGFKGMKTLIEKGYVIKMRSKLYTITDKGFEVYMEHVHDEVQQQLNNRNNNRNTNRNVNRNVNTNVNRNRNSNNASREWHHQSVGGSQRSHPTNNNNNNNINNNFIDLSGYNEEEMLKKAMLESEMEEQKRLQKQSELNNIIENNDLELQKQLFSSFNTNNNEGDDGLEAAMRLIDEQERIYNSVNNNNSNSNNSNNSNTVQKKYKYMCRICVKPVGYQTKTWYDKHMAKHKENNSMNDITDNINNSNYNNSNSNNSNSNNSNRRSLISRKRRQYNDSDSEIQILSHPSKKRRKHNINIIANDLDKVYNTFSLLCAKEKHKHGNVIYKGKHYKLKLYIDIAEQNLRSLDINQFDPLEWLEKENGIDRNNLKYVKLSNLDYLMVLTDERNKKPMVNIGIERKRWDDLERSVLSDGRGVNQKERLKNSPITRKYYLVEEKEGMIKDEYNRQICKEFLRDTEVNDGYMVKYTQSKHRSMDMISNWYFKVLSLLNNENGIGEELVLDSFSFEMFQQSQRINGKKSMVNPKMLKKLLAMGFDKKKCERALMAVKNESVEAALGYMFK